MKRIFTTLMACSLLILTAVCYAQVETPVFNPASGTQLYEPTEVAITCATPGAIIRYTTDGKNPVVTSDTCKGTVLVNKAMTIKAKAWVNDTTYSSVVSATYKYPTEFATVAAFKNATNKTEKTVVYKIKSDLTVVYVTPDHFVFVQDSTAGLMIYDRDGIFNAYTLANGSVIKGGLCGIYSLYNGNAQFIPTYKVTSVETGTPVQPLTMTTATLYGNFTQYEARLVEITDVKFEDVTAFGKGSTLGRKSITGDNKLMYCYNEFGTLEGVVPPTAPANVTGFALFASSEKRIAPRDANDIKVNDTTKIAYIDINSPANGSTVNGIVKVDLTVNNFEIAEGKGGVKVVMDNAASFWFNLDSLKAHDYKLASGTHNLNVSLVDSAEKIVSGAFECKSTFTVDLPNLSAPVFSTPAGLVYAESLNVTLTCADNTNATIYYTLDGTTPSKASTVYNAETGITLTSTKTIKAIACADMMDQSEVAVAAYRFPSVVINSPAEGAVVTGDVFIDLTVKDFVPGEDGNIKLLFYDENGAIAETAGISVPYEIELLKLIPTQLASGNYTLKLTYGERTIERSFSVKKLAAAAPEFSPMGGLFAEDVTVTLTSSTPNATIYYSTENPDSKKVFSKYTEPIEIATTNMPVTLRAYAEADGVERSEIVSAVYTFTDKPAISVTKSEISLKARNGKETIYVSGVNLSENIKLSSNKANFRLSASTLNYNVTDAPITVTYVGMKNDTATITLTSINHYDTVTTKILAIADLFVATPTFAPGYNNVSYIEPINVTMACGTTDATIRYTLDGTTPDENSPVYTKPVRITKTTTIKAKAWKGEQTPSEVASATYVFPTIDVVTPAENEVFVNAFKLNLKVNNFSIAAASNGRLKVEVADQPATYWTADSLNKLKEQAIDLPAGTYTVTLTLVDSNFNNINEPVSVVRNFSVKVAAPEFLPEPGKFYSSKNIQITSETEGAKVYYTIDGTEPTNASTLYTKPFVITKTTTVKAIAYKGTDSSEVVVGEYIYAAGINDVDELAQVSVYPNPTTSYVTVSTGNLKTSQYDIINLNGQVVYSETGVKNGDFQVSMENYPAGVYFLRVMTDKGMLVKKISKM